MLISALLLVSTLSAQAEQREDRFTYYGDQQEYYRAVDEEVFQTVYRDVQVPDICTRQVPYQEQVCRYVTNYRRECQQIPTQRQVCTLETRYRQECRQVMRQVCENRPVCQVINGRRVCHPQQVCHQIPQQECRQIPVQERVCRTVTDYQQVCRDVPYNEQVCHMETRYRNETYSCTRWERRPVQELVSRTKASVKFDVRKDPQLNVVQTEFITRLTSGNLQVTAQNLPGSENAFFLASKEIRRSQQGIETLLDAVYRVSVYDRNRFMAPFQQDVRIAPVARQGQLEVSLGQVSYAHLIGLQLRLSDVATGNVILDRTLTAQQVRFENLPGQTRAIIDLNVLDSAPVPAGQSYLVSVTVQAALGDREILLQEARPPLYRQGQSQVMVE